MPTPISCPCGTGRPYEICCGIYHNNPGSAPTAESLMRSRYSAFALGNFDYIVATQKLKEATDQSAEQIQESHQHTQWIKLTIDASEKGLQQDTTGMVAFSAHFKEGKHIGRLSERSLFKKIKGQWFYTSGELEVQNPTPPVNSATMKMGRNDPCLCGSGKKYKKCCALH